MPLPLEGQFSGKGGQKEGQPEQGQEEQRQVQKGNKGIRDSRIAR